jgi:23S rRNA pseudouridine2604 synthase
MQIKACSRREAEQYIEGGWVQVNGVVVEDPPFRVTDQQVSVAPHATLMGFAEVTLIVNKPPGWVDGCNADEQPGKNARAVLTANHRFAHDTSGVHLLKRHFHQLQPGVPLETGASGLLVFSQDWRTQRKLHEDMAVLEHEMMADVQGEVSDEAMQRIARALKDERAALPATKFSISSSTPQRSTLRLAVKGAHPGLAAHLCALAGLELLALRRIRVGRVTLGDLPPGQWRYLGAHERF